MRPRITFSLIIQLKTVLHILYRPIRERDYGVGANLGELGPQGLRGRGRTFHQLKVCFNRILVFGLILTKVINGRKTRNIPNS